jgi:hypothetical protein
MFPNVYVEQVYRCVCREKFENVRDEVQQSIVILLQLIIFKFIHEVTRCDHREIEFTHTDPENIHDHKDRKNNSFDTFLGQRLPIYEGAFNFQHLLETSMKIQ